MGVKKLKKRKFSGVNALTAAGVALIAISVATTGLVPFVGLADEWLIPLGLYLIKKGAEKKRKRK